MSEEVKRDNVIAMPGVGSLQSERDYQRVCLEFGNVMLELLQHSTTTREGLNTSTFNFLVQKLHGQFAYLHSYLGEALAKVDHAQPNEGEDSLPF